MELRSGARYIHIATHGAADSEAPTFHSIVLGLLDGRNDALHAADLIHEDLRGIDLLTLASCETALGRFDLGDNLRGLPAAFFLAGVSTIVGTLWQATSDSSHLFFTTLYREIRAGRSKLDSFVAAQRETRTVFPEYRDWGAFCLMGEHAHRPAWRQTLSTIPGIPSLIHFGADLRRKSDDR